MHINPSRHFNATASRSFMSRDLRKECKSEFSFSWAIFRGNWRQIAIIVHLFCTLRTSLVSTPFMLLEKKARCHKRDFLRFDFTPFSVLATKAVPLLHLFRSTAQRKLLAKSLKYHNRECFSFTEWCVAFWTKNGDTHVILKISTSVDI